MTKTAVKVVNGVTVMTMWEQMAAMIYDTRWMFLFLILLILADFRYGWGECSKRFAEAQRKGDTVLMDSYRWRTSRAIRRTLNKFVDYTVIVFIGLLFGQAFLPRVGVEYIWGAWAMAMCVCVCEANSFFGHFFYLHGIVVEKRTVKGFVRAFAVSLARKKNEDIGDALDEALGAGGNGSGSDNGNLS